MSEPSLSSQQSRFARGNPLSLYKSLVVGKASLPYFFWYEVTTTLCTNLSGLLGLGLRSLLYPSLFKSTSQSPAIGRGVLLRQPQMISFGKRVLLEDYTALDCRGEQASIIIGDNCSMGRFSSLTAKNASISLGAGVNISSHVRIASETSISIGESTLIAAFCYIGPGNHTTDKGLRIASSMEHKGGVFIGKNVWIGAHSTIMDGVSIGDNAVIGAYSFVTKSVSEGEIVFGIPAHPKKPTSSPI